MRSMRWVGCSTFLVACLTVQAVLADAPLRPPARFDHYPDMPVVVNRAANPTLHCKRWMAQYGVKVPSSHLFKACAGVIPNPTRCLMFLGPDVTPDIIRHEHAHCNGWPANHPK